MRGAARPSAAEPAPRDDATASVVDGFVPSALTTARTSSAAPDSPHRSRDERGRPVPQRPSVVEVNLATLQRNTGIYKRLIGSDVKLAVPLKAVRSPRRAAPRCPHRHAVVRV